MVINFIHDYTIFYKEHVFLTQLQYCFLFHESNFKFASVLLNIYNHHYTETNFIFKYIWVYVYAYVYVNSCRIFLIHFSFSASFQFLLIILTLFSFVHFLKHLLLFLDDNVNEESE